jgi:hypothetical protein
MKSPAIHLGPLSQSGRPTAEDTSYELRRLEDELAPIDIAGYHFGHRQSILPKYPPRIRVALMREYLRIAGPERSWPDGGGAGKEKGPYQSIARYTQ